MDNVGYRHLVLHRACSWFVLGLYLCKASYKLFLVQEYLSTLGARILEYTHTTSNAAAHMYIMHFTFCRRF